MKKRKKAINGSWRVDETYIMAKGKRVYLYRAVDKYGNTIDFMLRAKRDKSAAKAFFKKATKSSGQPIKVNIDKSGSNASALNSITISNYLKNVGGLLSILILLNKCDRTQIVNQMIDNS